MLSELLSIFRADNPLHTMGENFADMLKIACRMTLSAGEIYFGGKASAEERTAIYDDDVRVNKLERSIRKKVVAHLSMEGTSADVPYSLLLMSLVKDVERIGDYAKNLSEVIDIRSAPLPDDEITQELQELRHHVEASFRVTFDVFASSDRERATQMIQQGRDVAHRCEALVGRISRSSYDPSVTTALVLGTRYYKRIGGHVLNVLSSVVMPLHKVDYYDEDEIQKLSS
ncbi:MAG: hypothetical protein FI707_04215 [SAR202 cluster bacterium]|jgi:phosphate uptake regulator|nr:hypothetical protein [Acidobacteriota bacterium]MDP6371533.1 PhoU domain-containing protein [Vicinamibacterales bacterium]MQG56384.1 hypothetical protein [SAR202 cluster bacterium]MQG67977.1 hypothetical protein [SAR202 cluster bacterium]HAK57204.1 hypothetical protein [Acidobacteriota bacterium]|tara:strand:- start:30008 stop:30694 length:687 start_codon:yes stop_codon:yes gene_type:complete